jgi:hypothetical protein
VAVSFRARLLNHERAMDRRFSTEQVMLAREAGRLVLAASRPGGPVGRVVPNTRAARDGLRDLIWRQVVKPYYVGAADDPFSQDGQPLSPFARLLYDGIAGAVEIEAERQGAVLARVVDDPAVLGWLTGPRPATAGVVTEQRQRLFYDPYHRWIDPNGYRLSDRVWQTAVNSRSRIDQLLDYHIPRGAAAVDIAEELERFLQPGWDGRRTPLPYGLEGSYAARRLARTEVTAAAGRAVVDASIANPFVGGVRWRLSGSHGRPDICDENARGGPAGDGVYPPEAVPDYPAHPHDLCTLVPVPAGDRAALVERLRTDIQAARPAALAVRGAFSPEFLARAIMGGYLEQAVQAALVGLAA